MLPVDPVEPVLPVLEVLPVEPVDPLLPVEPVEPVAPVINAFLYFTILFSIIKTLSPVVASLLFKYKLSVILAAPTR